MSNFNNKMHFCGDIDTIAIRIKILNPEYGKFSDCTYQLLFQGKEYGLLDEKKLVSHNFIECSMLQNDIAYIQNHLKNRDYFFDLTYVLKRMSLKKSIKQILNFHYCRYLEKELLKERKDNLATFLESTTKVKDTDNIITFIMSEHDSMKNYFTIPYFFNNKFYLALIAIPNSEDEKLNAYNVNDFKIEEFNYFKVDLNNFKTMLICAEDILLNVMSKKTY